MWVFLSVGKDVLIFFFFHELFRGYVSNTDFSLPLLPKFFLCKETLPDAITPNLTQKRKAETLQRLSGPSNQTHNFSLGFSRPFFFFWNLRTYVLVFLVIWYLTPTVEITHAKEVFSHIKWQLNYPNSLNYLAEFLLKFIKACWWELCEGEDKYFSTNYWSSLIFLGILILLII